MKKLIIIPLLICLLGFGVYLGWNWIKSPLYSLWQAKQAMERHDLVTFEKYVDPDAVIGQLLEDAFVANQAAVGNDDQGSELGREFTIGLFNLMKPQLIKAMRDQLTVYIEKGTFATQSEPDDQEISVEEILTKVTGNGAKYQGVSYLRRDGKIATLGLKFLPSNTKHYLTLEFKLRERNGYWQLIELSNFLDYQEQLESLK